MKIRLVLILSGCLFSLMASAANLRFETPRFHVLISSSCAAHAGGCTQATMYEVSKISGQEITAQGRRLVHSCHVDSPHSASTKKPAGMNGCESSGYRFTKGDTNWLITPNGHFITLVGGVQQSSEQGSWVK